MRPTRLHWEHDPLRHLHFICCGIIPRARGRISLTSDTTQSLLPFYLTNGGLWKPTQPMAQAPKTHKSQLLGILDPVMFVSEVCKMGVNGQSHQIHEICRPYFEQNLRQMVRREQQ